VVATLEVATLEDPRHLELSALRHNRLSPKAVMDRPYLSSSFRRALAAVYYAVEYGSRFVLLCADPGLGKTTLLSHFERQVRNRSRTFLFSPSSSSASEVLYEVLDRIGGRAASNNLLAARSQLDQILATVAEAGRPLILLFDYNQYAERCALDTMRHFSSLQSFQKGLLRMVVAGTPTIAEVFASSEFADEIKRVALTPLLPDEVESYIHYRQRLVGTGNQSLVTAKSCRLIAKKSLGNPSIINKICLTVLDDLPEEESERPNKATKSESRTPSGGGPTKSVRSDRKPSLWMLASASHGTAVLTSIVLIMVSASFAYRSMIETPAKAGLSVPSAEPLHSMGIDKARPRQLMNPMQRVAVGATGAADQAATHKLPKEAARRTDHTEVILGQRQIASPPVPSPIPLTATYDAAGVRTRGRLSPIPKSLAVAFSNEASAHPSQHGSKIEQEFPPAPLSGLGVSSTPALPAPEGTAVSRRRFVSADAVVGERIKNVTRTAKERASIYIKLGDSYMNRGYYDKAISSFSSAIAIAPDNREAKERVERARRARATEEELLQ
jgi:type II secretory pathway predicted ATPase ExeA